ncbi:MAG: heat shock protein Hsp20 [Verrucomicrobiales bacterium]|nr:heat shock protein Hsp20 [Verrucomicrobiales bacterium]
MYMTLTRWQKPEQNWTVTPFRRMTTLRDEIDHMFDRAFGQFFESPTQTQLGSGWVPGVDLYEDKDAFTVKCELPGMKKEEIDISLHEGFLTISGERKHEEQKTTGEVYRTERYEGRFSRSLSLPSKVNAEKINATYKDGVLTVVLPKAEEAKPKQIQVNIK